MCLQFGQRFFFFVSTMRIAFTLRNDSEFSFSSGETCLHILEEFVYAHLPV